MVGYILSGILLLILAGIVIRHLCHVVGLNILRRLGDSRLRN